MQTLQPEARGIRPISIRSLHEHTEESDDHALIAERLIDMGILRFEWRPKLIAFGAGGWLLARELSRISGVESAFVPVAELASAWPGGPVFAAAAFDNTVVVDEAMKELCAVSRQQFRELVKAAYDRVAELAQRLHTEPSFPDLHRRTAILVDDGRSTPLAARAAIAATRNCGAQRVVLVAPASARRNMQQLADDVDLGYCGSLRSGRLASSNHR